MNLNKITSKIDFLNFSKEKIAREMSKAFQSMTENWFVTNESVFKHLLAKALKNSKKNQNIEGVHEMEAGLGRLDLLYWYDKVATIYECKYTKDVNSINLEAPLLQIYSKNYLEAVLRILQNKRKINQEYKLNKIRLVSIIMVRDESGTKDGCVLEGRVGEIMEYTVEEAITISEKMQLGYEKDNI